MIVRAGGLTLVAPDTVPEAARGPIEELRGYALRGLPVADADPQYTAIEQATFGAKGARRLKRRGKSVRIDAYRQLLTGWGERGLLPRPTGQADTPC